MKARLLIASIAALATAPAMAGNYYVLGSIGQTIANPDTSYQDNILRNAGASGLQSTTDKTDLGYKVQVGYQFNPNFAIEGGYTDLGKVKYRAQFTGGNATVDWTVDGWNIDALGLLPLDDRLTLFAKLGAFDGNLKGSGHINAFGSSVADSASSTNWGVKFGLGVNYLITRKIGLRFELEQYRKIGDKDTTGEAEVKLISAGVFYRF